MRICLVHEEYPEETNFGGIATYQKRLAEEYVKQGHKVYVIARGLAKNQHYKENGVDITRIFVKPTEATAYSSRFLLFAFTILSNSPSSGIFLYFSSSLYREIWASSHVLTDHLEVVDYAEKHPVSICS